MTPIYPLTVKIAARDPNASNRHAIKASHTFVQQPTRYPQQIRHFTTPHNFLGCKTSRVWQGGLIASLDLRLLMAAECEES